MKITKAMAEDRVSDLRRLDAALKDNARLRELLWHVGNRDGDEDFEPTYCPWCKWATGFRKHSRRCKAFKPNGEVR